MKEFLLNSPSFHTHTFYTQFVQILGNHLKAWLRFISVFVAMLFSSDTVQAAQGDRIITIIKTLTQDIYTDFVYLSLGFATTISIFHLIMVVVNSGDEQARKKHVKAIAIAIGAWVVINVFALVVAKIFELTGQSTPADIFNTGGYN